MTIETRYTVNVDDLLTVRFECTKCHSSTSVPVKTGLSEYVQRLGGQVCGVCHTPWNIVSDGAEHKAIFQFAMGLETIASFMEGRGLEIKIEVRGEAKP